MQHPKKLLQLLRSISSQVYSITKKIVFICGEAMKGQETRELEQFGGHMQRFIKNLEAEKLEDAKGGRREFSEEFLWVEIRILGTRGPYSHPNLDTCAQTDEIPRFYAK
ncbi:hypothetical protein B9Z55_003223 [Caenorhabditis nigoni]|uniref:Uncharacterized protein n=1 Tax=Caenorhabditis nigoni TaxID=1611254 RepID=A0A2G5VPG9_9PELO|nr:hypothetical protein B9Z55_003223 [Caenorhabditis nigoni]